MTAYKTYRHIPGPSVAFVKAAVRHFYRHHQALPASIAVSPAEVDEVQRACTALELAVTVEGNGGCLVSEVWLEEEG